MNKGIIYYTRQTVCEPIFHGVQEEILKSGLPIVSASIKPLDFGVNVIVSDPSIVGYFKRILAALETSTADYVFFCEDDVLYNQTHFDFNPSRDDTFYYNTNVWKWDYKSDRVIYYNEQGSNDICVKRELAVEFFRRRLKLIYENGWDKIPTKGNPSWVRQLGYEPGRNKRNKLEPARAEDWKSLVPIINIRHDKNNTPKKMEQKDFRNKPTGWKEDIIQNVLGYRPL